MEHSQSIQETQPEYQALDSSHPFTQWLRTYLLWARVLGLNPQVFAFVPDGEPSVENNLRWQKDNLWISSDLLERVSPRLLAILAVRNYIEQAIWRRYLVLVVLSGILLLSVTLAIAAYVRRLLGANPLWELVHLFVLPVMLEVPALLRDLARREADDEAFERLSDPQTFLQAIETALEESYRGGETEKQLQKILKRLNRLRKKLGEPPLALQEIKQRVGEPIEQQEELQEEDTSAVNIAIQEEE